MYDVTLIFITLPVHTGLAHSGLPTPGPGAHGDGGSSSMGGSSGADGAGSSGGSNSWVAGLPVSDLAILYNDIAAVGAYVGTAFSTAFCGLIGALPEEARAAAAGALAALGAGMQAQVWLCAVVCW